MARKRTKYTPEIDAMLREKTVAEAMKILGIDRSAVNVRRRKLGLPLERTTTLVLARAKAAARLLDIARMVDEGKTNREIGLALGVSKERARQLKAKLKEK